MTKDIRIYRLFESHQDMVQFLVGTYHYKHRILRCSNQGDNLHVELLQMVLPLFQLESTHTRFLAENLLDTLLEDKRIYILLETNCCRCNVDVDKMMNTCSPEIQDKNHQHIVDMVL